MSLLRRSSDRGAGRRRRAQGARRLAQAGAWLLVALLALPLLDLLRHAGAGLAWATLSASDSIEAATAGLRGALQTSLLMLLPIVLAAAPLGLAVAVYLEELGGPGRWPGLVGRSVRHLALLPPVVFGLLGFGGLVVVLGLPVGTPLLAGAVLGLMLLPRIVLVGQLALQKVPPEVRDAGFAMGASPTQVVVGHVLPRAAPAMLGACCLMLARALGEAAPLLLVGFAAFAAGYPQSPTEPGIPLSVMVFRWGELAEPLFAAKAAVAALVLLVLVALLAALGSRLERRERTA